MKVNVKLIIFVLVVLAVGVIFVLPYLNPGEDRQFAVSPQPGEKLSQALAKGRPVFLEFYSYT